MPCIFCGNSKLTKEHLYGKWWKQFYPPNVHQIHERGVHTVVERRADGQLAKGQGVLQNVGYALSRTTKVVCKKCNNNWMSDIEMGMKKAFEAIYKRGDQNVTAIQSSAIRTWMYLKFCLFDRAYSGLGINLSLDDEFTGPPSDEVLTNELQLGKEAQWRKFYGGTKIPSGYRFFVARGGGPDLGFGFNHVPVAKLHFETDDEGKVIDYNAQCLQTCIFEIGEFLALLTNNPVVAAKFSNKVYVGPSVCLTELVDGCSHLHSKRIYGPVFEEAILSWLEFVNPSSVRLSRNYEESEKLRQKYLNSVNGQ